MDEYQATTATPTAENATIIAMAIFSLSGSVRIFCQNVLLSSLSNGKSGFIYLINNTMSSMYIKLR